MDNFIFPDWANTDLRETKYGVVSVNHDKCNGCSWCVQICPTKSLEIKDKKAKMAAYYECVSCGNCQAVCPNDAITLIEVPQWPGYYKKVEGDRGKLSKPRLIW